jgi:hypothetical protein
VEPTAAPTVGKGRLSDSRLLRDLAVLVVTGEQLALVGLAHVAARLAGGSAAG